MTALLVQKLGCYDNFVTVCMTFEVHDQHHVEMMFAQVTNLNTYANPEETS